MPAKIITVAQQKGGSGKTTVAAHLAVAFMEEQRRVALIDTDPQHSLSEWFNVREKEKVENKAPITFTQTLGWRVQNEVYRLADTHDIIIIDSPPHVQSDAKSVIRIADLIIIPVQPSPTDLWATDATIAIAEAEHKEYRLLINRFQSNNNVSKSITPTIKNRLTATLGNRVAFSASFMEGKCVTESFPISAAANEVRKMVKEVNKILTR